MNLIVFSIITNGISFSWTSFWLLFVAAIHFLSNNSVYIIDNFQEKTPARDYHLDNGAATCSFIIHDESHALEELLQNGLQQT